MKCLGKMLLTAMAGWLALNVAMFVTFRLIGFGMDGDGILMNPRYQSSKLIAVWSTLEPLPLVVARPLPIIAGLYGFAFMHALIYRRLSPAWRPGILPRALRFAALLFGMCYLFWEFFTPFNQLGEPLPLIALELVFWAVTALAESLAIAMTAEYLWPSPATVVTTARCGHTDMARAMARRTNPESVPIP